MSIHLMIEKIIKKLCVERIITSKAPHWKCLKSQNLKINEIIVSETEKGKHMKLMLEQSTPIEIAAAAVAAEEA